MATAILITLHAAATLCGIRGLVLAFVVINELVCVRAIGGNRDRHLSGSSRRSAARCDALPSIALHANCRICGNSL